MFTQEARSATWTIDAEVLSDGLMVARLAYAQMPNGYLVEAGGWGDRNNLDIVVAGLQNLTGVLKDAAVHTLLDGEGKRQTHWSAVTRLRYGSVHE